MARLRKARRRLGLGSSMARVKSTTAAGRSPRLSMRPTKQKKRARKRSFCSITAVMALWTCPATTLTSRENSPTTSCPKRISRNTPLRWQICLRRKLKNPENGNLLNKTTFDNKKSFTKHRPIKNRFLTLFQANLLLFAKQKHSLTILWAISWRLYCVIYSSFQYCQSR